MKVLVTDGENRSALAVTRSLGRRGCEVVVAGTNRRCLASTSRFCSCGASTSDPLQYGNDFVADVRNLVLKEGIDAIFPVTEQAIYQLNTARQDFTGKIIACPPDEKLHVIADKANLCRLAEQLDVPIPKTIYIDSLADLSGAFSKIEKYPVVVKPALSKIREGAGFLSAGVMYARTREELELLYATDSALKYSSLIQEKIVGPGTGLFTLYDTDRHLALFSHRRLREKPPSGGVSVVSESMPLDDEMVQAADRLLSTVGWQGVAMVEFKRDARDGRPKLMEINGRFWGSLQLAVACGVDFPGLLLDYLCGKIPDPPLADYRVGHKMKWFLGTLDHLLIRLKNSDEKLNLPPGAPSKFSAIAEFLRIWESNTSFDVFDPRDPGPFLFELNAYLRHALRGRG